MDHFNLIYTTGRFLYPPKVENQRLSVVFRKCRKKPMAWNCLYAGRHSKEKKLNCLLGWVWSGMPKYARFYQNLICLYPVDTGRKLHVHKTFRRPPGRPLNVLCTFNLRPVHRIFKNYMYFTKLRCVCAMVIRDM